LQVYRGPGLFAAWGIDADLEAALERRHNLPGGGALSIDPTPTLTAIDVDRAASSQSLRSINLEAAERLAELIPLRNIGGLVVIDFLRMATSQDRAIVAQRLTSALKDDPLRAQVLGFTRAGLCEVTRPRSGRSLVRALQAPCVVCAGTGYVGDARVRGLEAIRAVIAASAANPTMALMIAAAPAIARMLMGTLSASLDEAECLIGRAIPIIPEPRLMPDGFEVGPDMDML
jgi:ribonuclease G